MLHTLSNTFLFPQQLLTPAKDTEGKVLGGGASLFN